MVITEFVVCFVVKTSFINTLPQKTVILNDVKNCTPKMILRFAQNDSLFVLCFDSGFRMVYNADLLQRLLCDMIRCYASFFRLLINSRTPRPSIDTGTMICNIGLKYVYMA